MDGGRPYGYLCLFWNEVRANRTTARTFFYAALETTKNWRVDTESLVYASVQERHGRLFGKVSAGINLRRERLIHFLPKSIEICRIL